MKRTLTTLIAASIAVVALSSPAFSQNQEHPTRSPNGSVRCDASDPSTCPEPGTYLPQSNARTIYTNGDFTITWQSSTVQPPPKGDVPHYLVVKTRYTNNSNRILYFTCKGAEDPSKMKEWFLRDGRQIGYVAAQDNICSAHPNLNWSLAPGRSFGSWARFHNVPWLGDKIAIEWTFGRSAYGNPYDNGPL